MKNSGRSQLERPNVSRVLMHDVCGYIPQLCMSAKPLLLKSNIQSFSDDGKRKGMNDSSGRRDIASKTYRMSAADMHYVAPPVARDLLILACILSGTPQPIDCHPPYGRSPSSPDNGDRSPIDALSRVPGRVNVPKKTGREASQQVTDLIWVPETLSGNPNGCQGRVQQTERESRGSRLSWSLSSSADGAGRR